MAKPHDERAKKAKPRPDVAALAPVELDEDQVAAASEADDLDVYQDDLAVEWEPEYTDDGEDDELESDYDEADFAPDDDGDDEFGPGTKHGPQPRLASAPKHGPGHQHGPHGHGPHEHGPGPKKRPGKKAPAKKVPGKKAPEKKAPGKKAPGKKAPGPKKHPGHRPSPHASGPGHGPGREDPAPDFGYGSGGFGDHFGFGSDPRFRRRGSGTGRRGRPGDVRAAILSLLAEQPMHGYEMIQQIAERSSGAWRPSPGSVYPTLQLLGDEGLIVGSESAGSKKLFELSEEGRTAAEQITSPPWTQYSQAADSGHSDAKAALEQLFSAVAQAAYAATVGQQQRVVAILKSARSQIYTLLAESD